MVMMGDTNPMNQPATGRYRVLAVEPDDRLRTRMTLELAGIAAAPVTTIDDLMREIGEGESTVVLFGASLANPMGFEAVRKVTRAFPECAVVLMAEEMTLPLLQEALRAGVRDAVTVDAGESQIRQTIERVGETVA